MVLHHVPFPGDFADHNERIGFVELLVGREGEFLEGKVGIFLFSA